MCCISIEYIYIIQVYINTLLVMSTGGKGRKPNFRKLNIIIFIQDTIFHIIIKIMRNTII